MYTKVETYAYMDIYTAVCAGLWDKTRISGYYQYQGQYK